MAFLDFLRSLFGSRPQGTTTGISGRSAPLPDSIDEPPQICSPKVLLLIYNPTMDAVTGKKLVDYMNWSRPDDLVSGCIADILQASGGLVRYQVAERHEVDEFPPLVDGFRYTPGTFLDVLRRGAQPHNPSGIDYAGVLGRFNVLECIADNKYDEVWIMGFPYAGLYESTMGGAGAFWCNGPQLANTAGCPRRFVVMGFNYERGVGEMLHSYAHRSESILAKVFNSLDFLMWAYKPGRSPATITPGQALNLFQRFVLFEQIAPGMSGVGLVHYPPNGAKDYDLGNPNLVKSTCYDWMQFPNFKGDVRMISSTEWGGGDERHFQQWWLRHLPKVAGRQNGIHNNWWQYIANPNNVIA
ncbi:MAG: hypothetical protein ACM3MF_02765 [Anaerolineae bacterium]